MVAAKARRHASWSAIVAPARGSVCGPVTEQRDTRPERRGPPRRDRIASRAAERAAHAGTRPELAVETLHDERHVVIAQRPARGDDDAGAGGEEGAREAQRAFAREERRRPPTRTPTTRRGCRRDRAPRSRAAEASRLRPAAPGARNTAERSGKAPSARACAARCTTPNAPRAAPFTTRSDAALPWCTAAASRCRMRAIAVASRRPRAAGSSGGSPIPVPRGTSGSASTQRGAADDRRLRLSQAEPERGRRHDGRSRTARPCLRRQFVTGSTSNGSRCSTPSETITRRSTSAGRPARAPASNVRPQGLRRRRPGSVACLALSEQTRRAPPPGFEVAPESARRWSLTRLV